MAEDTDASAPAEEAAPALPDTAEQPAPAKRAKAQAADPEPEADPAQARLERVQELIRGPLRDSPLSRSDAAWNHLQAQLPGIAAAIVKEL